MQSIEYNKENHSILSQIYDIVAELQNQDKQVILYIVKIKIYLKTSYRQNKGVHSRLCIEQN